MFDATTIARAIQRGNYIYYTYIRVIFFSFKEHFLHHRPRASRSPCGDNDDQHHAKCVTKHPTGLAHSAFLHSATAADKSGKKWRKREPNGSTFRQIHDFPAVYISLSLFFSPLSLSLSFFARKSRRRSPPILPIDIFPVHASLSVSASFETDLTRRSPGDIIENKIQTHLLLGQTYPCCQSRCHTHTTLTSTPKSDIVCWNRPSLYLFSRTQRLLLNPCCMQVKLSQLQARRRLPKFTIAICEPQITNGGDSELRAIVITLSLVFSFFFRSFRQQYAYRLENILSVANHRAQNSIRKKHYPYCT